MREKTLISRHNEISNILYYQIISVIFGIYYYVCPGLCIPFYFNNNNNNIYLLQMGCHPVAVITLHVFPNTTNKFT
jgi:hypothetical protein